LQNRGIGRGMKVGKESIAGVMAALEAWEIRDHIAVRANEDAALDLWLRTLRPFTDLDCRLLPDPTGNPLQRLRVRPLPQSRWNARGLADALAAGEPPVMVRDYQTDQGHIDLDPCNLHAGEAQTVATQLTAILQIR
jgi:seryl-tRNA(Sec) selenium transferase